MPGFQPLSVFSTPVLGRCPRLGWMRAVGPKIWTLFQSHPVATARAASSFFRWVHFADGCAVGFAEDEDGEFGDLGQFVGAERLRLRRRIA